MSLSSMLMIVGDSKGSNTQGRMKNVKNPSTCSEESKKKEPPPKQSLPKQPPPKESSSKYLSKKDNIKKDPPKGEPKPKSKDKEIELDIDVRATIRKMTMQVPIKEIAKLSSKRWCVKQALGIERVEGPPIMLQNIHLSNANLAHEPLTTSSYIIVC